VAVLNAGDDLLEEVARLLLNKPPLFHYIVKELARLRGLEHLI
jgi:hypothetical protein